MSYSKYSQNLNTATAATIASFTVTNTLTVTTIQASGNIYANGGWIVNTATVIPGATGATGVQGPAGTISVGSVTTGSAAVTNVGTSSTAILNFVIPQGATGFTGATGVTGNTGTSGLTGLTGATGFQGATGVTGNTGTTGLTGPTGATGVQGATGQNGGVGATGATGQQGVVSPYSDWASWTPTASGLGGGSISTAVWQRLGNTVNFQVTLTSDAVTNGYFSLPVTAAANWACGTWIYRVASTAYPTSSGTWYIGASGTNLYFSPLSSSSAGAGELFVFSGSYRV
jgi:hypothetical protein